MTATELRITWGVITAQYAVFLLFLGSPRLREIAEPFTPFLILLTIYFRSWILTDSAERKRRQKTPITNRQGILFIVVIVGVIAGMFVLDRLVSYFGIKNESLVVIGIAVLVCIWCWECVNAWRKYAEKRP